MGNLQQREDTCAPTCIFQEALQGGLNTGQKISTHVLKLASDTKTIKNGLICFKADKWWQW